jgi:hypothetical protein
MELTKGAGRLVALEAGAALEKAAAHRICTCGSKLLAGAVGVGWGVLVFWIGAELGGLCVGVMRPVTWLGLITRVGRASVDRQPHIEKSRQKRMSHANLICSLRIMMDLLLSLSIIAHKKAEYQEPANVYHYL